jgi:AraC family transcriptional regulator
MGLKLINNNSMQQYPFIEIDDNQDIMQQMTPFIRQHSLNLPWDSFYLLDMEFPPTIIPEVSWDAAVITCYTEPRVSNIEISAAGSTIVRKITPGKIGLWKPHFPVGLIWYEPIRIQKCILSLQLLERIALQTTSLTQVKLTNCWWDKEDLLITQIIRALINEMSDGCPHGRFYGDSLVTTLCAHLLRNYTEKKQTIALSEGGLSRPKLKLALEYINDQLSSDLSLSDIAAELDISQYHFCRLFKQSMGISPHQYIIHQRIEHAQELLKKNSNRIADISIEVGFANQGHFTHHFRKITGMTPKQYRDS